VELGLNSTFLSRNSTFEARFIGWQVNLVKNSDNYFHIRFKIFLPINSKNKFNPKLDIFNIKLRIKNYL